ncbi:ATP-dependent Zn protease [Coprinopsis sp. MPI-PUGE-AT-0042]|nr:ATP-dependent Zn protease [Coprinopsis sp. MPI-PUGE-AT-0042]
MSDNEDFSFVDVVFGKPPVVNDGHGHHPKLPTDKNFHERTVDSVSAVWAYPIIVAAENLRKLYPKYSLVLTKDLSFLNLPGVTHEPLKDMPLTTNVLYASLPKKAGIPGLLFDRIEMGGFQLAWNGNDYIVYVITVPGSYGGYEKQGCILHHGPEDPSRLLLLASGSWANELHDEIWVYDQGWWNKDHSLWSEIQKADWKEVILKDEFKKAIQKDVYGFFSSEKIYKDLGIPWKRGLIMYGPPGNGKTISLKAIMKDCEIKGFTPLYVKSFHHYAGDERAMIEVFEKARAVSPCIVIMEDLDSLITDYNRSFFLNQVDGLHNNDGLLLIGTTNHFDRLDPGLSTRPSRFDRKYNFDDPDEESRKLYVLYWKKKLESNHDIDFSDKLVDDIAKSTSRFSFAYLKEAFVSALVTLAGWDSNEKRPSFESVIKAEIAKLSKQLDKPEEVSVQPEVLVNGANAPSHLLAAIDAFSLTEGGSKRIYGTSQPTGYEQSTDNIRSLANRLSDIADAQSFRRYCGGGASSSRVEPVPRDFDHGSRRCEERERHRRAERHRERPQMNDRFDRRHAREGSMFDLGGTTHGYEPSYYRYPIVANTFPVHFTPDEVGPSGSDLA